MDKLKERFKSVKNLKLKLVFSIVFLILMVVQIGPYLVLADENTKTFSYENVGAYATNEWYDGINVFFTKAYLDENVAYCVDFANRCPVQGADLTYMRNLSSVSAAVLLYGYPYSSAEALGVDDDEEACLATQFALWAFGKSTSTPDSQKTDRIFDLRNIKAKAGYEDKVERIKEAAQRLINRAANAPYYVDPKLTVDKNYSKVGLYGDFMLVGPYAVNASGFDVSSVDVSLVNAPATAVLCDSVGNPKTSFENGDAVFVKMSEKENATKFTIRFNAKGSTRIGKVYGTGEDDGRQDYATITTEPVDLTENLHVSTPELLGNIKIVKVDQDENPISGVTFEIKDSAGNLIARKDTDSNGLIELNNVKIDEYTITEVEGPEGYIWESAPQTLNVRFNQTSTITFVNVKVQGGIKIVKVDEDNKPLKDVEFAILDSSKNQIGDTIKTNSEGIAYKGNLPVGKYYIKEVSAPANVIKDEEYHEVEITNANETLVCNAKNYYVRGKLKVIKTGEDGAKLAGVKFDVLDENGNLVTALTTDENGEASTDYLKNGKYFLQETYVPGNKYKLNTEKQEVTMAYKDVVVKVENKLSVGKIRLIKTDNFGNVIEGVKFEIRRDDNDELVDTIVTNKDGIAETKDLPLGTYYYKEIEAPDYVDMDQTEYIIELDKPNYTIINRVKNNCKTAPIVIEKVDEKGNLLKGVEFELYKIENGKEVTVEKLVTGEDGTATSKNLLPGTYYIRETKTLANLIKKDDIIKVEHTYNGSFEHIRNDFAKGTLKIVKVDENSSPIKDVVFEIKDASGKVVDTITTNEEGIAISKKLELGTYTYQEIKAPDYVVKDATVGTFKLTENNQVIEKKVENKLVKGSLKILKVNEEKQPIADVTFKIFDANKKEIATQKTGKDGIVTFDNLSVGVKYYYQETKAPVNYVLDNELKEFTLELANKDITLTVENKLFKKTVKFQKVDDDGDPVPNVTFNIYASDKKTLIAEGLKTDEKGYVETAPLPIGEYYYQETSAPENYVAPNKDLISFKISNDNLDIVIKVVNHKLTGKLIITKVDKDTNKVLSGVTFEVYDENGKLLKEIVTNDEGIATISDLNKGKYYFKETKTLENYILDDKTYEFSISRNAQEVKVTVKNEAKKLPQTGGFLSTDALIVIIVSVVSIAGYVVISLVAKNKHSNE